MPLGRKDLGTLITLGTHLLLHRIADVAGRIDILQLYTIDLNAPLIGGLIKDIAQLTIDRISAGKSLVEIHFADNVTQTGLRKHLNSHRQIANLIHSSHGIYNLEVEYGIDLRYHIVACNHTLASKVVYGLSQIDMGDAAKAYYGSTLRAL